VTRLVKPLLELVLMVPYMASACALVMAVRGLVKGQIRRDERFGPRTASRAANPLRFWTEIVLYCVAAIFFAVLGVLATGHALP
jgi:hypothetical protein